MRQLEIVIAFLFRERKIHSIHLLLRTLSNGFYRIGSKLYPASHLLFNYFFSVSGLRGFCSIHGIDIVSIVEVIVGNSVVVCRILMIVYIVVLIVVLIVVV
ncbi:hypothetical protein SDC9_84014 [bioreactor metagenome]|uniref:Uncharacterized protein n=1 Tax=bioreactor metagenome TaxID=1076179 RepID=A0A644Z931_9ZZZZ